MRHPLLIAVTLVLFLCSCGLSTEENKKESFPSFNLIEEPHFARRPITGVYIDSEGTNYVGTWEGITLDYRLGIFSYLDRDLTSKAARIKEMYGLYYARVGDKSLISSADGKTWTEVVRLRESIYDYVVLKSGRIVIGSFEGVYYKDPEETEWTNKRFFFAGNSISNPNKISHLVESKDGSVIAGTHHGIYRSLDEGENWDRVSDLIPSHEDHISQLLVKESGDILAYGTRYAFVSEDNGDTWFTSTLPSRGVFKAIEDNGIEYILIGGNIWARRTSRDIYVNLEIADELEENFPAATANIDNFYLRGEKLLIYNSVYPSAVYKGFREEESDIWDELK